MDDFKFHSAAEKLYHYFWHTFADKIIESAKLRLNGDNQKEKQAAQYVLMEVLKTNIKLLHPFMPFVTERVWQELISAKLVDEKSAKNKKFLMVEEWPTFKSQ
jgi:valyl-tRNA synthetase